MTVKNNLRQTAKSLNIRLTQNGKYKTIKQLKSEIDKITLTGGELNVSDTKEFLNNSYDKTLNNVNGFIIDKQLSGQRVKVYHNPQNNKTVVVHRGTNSIQDWGTNLSMSLGHKGKRFNHAKNIQKQAEEKYKNTEVITLGHSQGARWSEMLGKNEVITLNKPTLPLDLIQGKKVKKNQTDIKTSRDFVSILRGLQKGKKAKVIKSKIFNPLKEHTVDVLDRLDENEMLGVPETERKGGSMKSNFIKNIIYKEGFDPSRVKNNPSLDILNKVKSQKIKQKKRLTTINDAIEEKINETKYKKINSKNLLGIINYIKQLYDRLIIDHKNSKLIKNKTKKTKERKYIKYWLQMYFISYKYMIREYNHIKKKIDKKTLNIFSNFQKDNTYLPANLKNIIGKKFILDDDAKLKIFSNTKFSKDVPKSFINDAYYFFKNSKKYYTPSNEDDEESDDEDIIIPTIKDVKLNRRHFIYN